MPVYPGIIAGARIMTAPATMPTFIAAGLVWNRRFQPMISHQVLLRLRALPAGDWLFAQVIARGAGSGAQLTCATPAGWTLIHTDVTTVSTHVKQFIFTQEHDGFAMPAFNWDGGTNYGSWGAIEDLRLFGYQRHA